MGTITTLPRSDLSGGVRLSTSRRSAASSPSEVAFGVGAHALLFYKVWCACDGHARNGQVRQLVLDAFRDDNVFRGAVDTFTAIVVATFFSFLFRF